MELSGARSLVTPSLTGDAISPESAEFAATESECWIAKIRTSSFQSPGKPLYHSGFQVVPMILLSCMGWEIELERSNIDNLGPNHAL